MSSNAILIPLGVAGGIALLVVSSVWSRANALTALRAWAKAEGLELLAATRRSFVPLWCSGKGYQFYRITVRDKGGGIHRAWVKCPDFNHAEPHNIKVTWDEQPKA